MRKKVEGWIVHNSIDNNVEDKTHKDGLGQSLGWESAIIRAFTLMRLSNGHRNIT